MKRSAVLLVFFLFLLAGHFSLHAAFDSAYFWKVAPECIWAPATGGGTWMTEIQITNNTSYDAQIQVYFYYGGGNSRGPFTLYNNLTELHSIKYSNILQTLDNLDSGAFTYYGKVGAVWFSTTNTSSHIQVTAKTVNGNYGKTLPGLSVLGFYTSAQFRQMTIPNIVNNTTYRTFTGFFNTSDLATYAVDFYIINAAHTLIGGFTKTFVPYEYMAFNPFVEAGISGGTYDNCWLLVVPSSGGTGERGIMCYGAIANNYSNDPSALLAYSYP